MSTLVALRPRTAAHRNFLLSVATVVAVLLMWQVLSVVVHSALFPSAFESLRALGTLATSGTLGEQIVPTVTRVFIGFAIGSAIGAILGLLMGSIRVVRRFFEPYINFFRSVTPIVWISPSIIWFGPGNKAMVFLIIYASVFIVLVNTMAGVGHLHRDRVRMARTFGSSAWQVFMLVTIPATVPFVMTGLRMAMGNSVMTAVSSEIVGGNDGIGFLIYNSRVFLEFDVMFACIALLGAFGFLADRAFVVVQRTLLQRYRLVD